MALSFGTRHNDLETTVYRRRWIMLVLFVSVSASNGMQWPEYTVISDTITRFYGVQTFAVNWTSMIYMVTKVLFILPAAWFLNKKGLRWALSLAALGTCLGSWIKMLAVSPDRFSLSFLGQTVAGASQVFILNLPARVAAAWFTSHEVASAFAIGVLGNQAGVALGFAVPPILVRQSQNLDAISADLSFMFCLAAGMSTLVGLLVLLMFQAQPPLPASHTQTSVCSTFDSANMIASVRNLLTNGSYVLLLLSYGINIGVFYAISTLLNQVVLRRFPMSDDAGTLGLVLVLAGMVGSLVFGLIVDQTGRFKETTLAVYVFSLMGLLAYTYSLISGNISMVYLATIILGFFVTGYLPLGLELAAELTYPESGDAVTGLMHVAVQVFGILLTVLYAWVIENADDLWGNVTLAFALVIGTVFTAFIRSDLRRSAAHKLQLWEIGGGINNVSADRASTLQAWSE